ncbi:MAG: dihydropyrimidinase [Spirochaetales bacterium]
MAERKLLIKNGRVVDPNGSQEADLLIVGEKVQAVALRGTLPIGEETEVINAEGLLVLPGLIDPHLHFNSPFMGTCTVHGFGTGSVAAAWGGITTVIDFSTQNKGESILKNLEQKEEEAKDSCIDWSLSGILLDAEPQTLKEIPRLIQEGIPTNKCFTTYKHSGRLMSDEGMLKILEVTASHGGMLMVHCEHDALIDYRVQKALESGKYEPIQHAYTRPVEAERMAVNRVIELVQEVPAPLYLAHISAAASIPLIRTAQEQGLPVYAETCTHYLCLTEEALLKSEGQLFICSPPLRKELDQKALWKALKAGILEIVSSDDAGVPPEDNLRIGAGRFDRVPSGMSGLEARLYILYTEGVAKGRISLEKLVELTATRPAERFGLAPEKGRLVPGADADLVLYDPRPRWTMSATNLHMNTSFCPFEGWTIQGKIHSVFSRGEYLIRNSEFVGRPGRGRRIFRRLKGTTPSLDPFIQKFFL